MIIYMQWWTVHTYTTCITPYRPHSTTGEPVTILHPTGHTVLQERQWLFYTLQATQYYRRASDYFTPYWPHSTTGEPVTILHPTGHTQYYRRASDYFTPYRPHSPTGEPVTSMKMRLCPVPYLKLSHQAVRSEGKWVIHLEREGILQHWTLHKSNRDSCTFAHSTRVRRRPQTRCFNAVVWIIPDSR